MKHAKKQESVTLKENIAYRIRPIDDQLLELVDKDFYNYYKHILIFTGKH
jgi:hypothetical protein